MFIAFLAMPARAEEALDCPIGLGDAVTLEEEQLRLLFKVRGIEVEFTERLADDLQTSVADYLSFEQSPGDTRPRAFLFYIGNSDMLCAMYWRTGGGLDDLFVVERLAIRPADIVPAIDELVSRMRGEGRLRNATPRRDEGGLRGPTTVVPINEEQAETALEGLSAMLVPPRIAEHMVGLSSLSILPCLNIGIVPFSALDPDGDGVPLVETTVIHVEADLRHVYDGRVFGWDQSPQVPAIFGDPDASGDPDWAFARLPGAAQEATTIAAQFGVDAVLGRDATRGRLLELAADADLIHVAAHGISSTERPLEGSFLALADGRLTAREIQDLQLNAFPLVVLSACQTGLGGPLDAGIIGLARAFILAGASSTMSTLWDVDDAVTAQIMVDFVGKLATMSPAEALRSAQAEARKVHAHPRYWSGFMLFGSRTVTLPPAGTD
jgi:hypothetical protein